MSKTAFRVIAIALLPFSLLQVVARHYPLFHSDLMDGLRGLLLGVVIGTLILMSPEKERRRTSGKVKGAPELDRPHPETNATMTRHDRLELDVDGQRVEARLTLPQGSNVNEPVRSPRWELRIDGGDWVAGPAVMQLATDLQLEQQSIAAFVREADSPE